MFFSGSCKKDYSYEGGNMVAIANGSVQDSLGNCMAVRIAGSYLPSTIFTDSNYILVQANITNAGNYSIYTDTVNGFYFRTAQFIGNTGHKSFKLACFGKPIKLGTFIFTLHFGTSNCKFTLPQDSAVFSFAGNVCGQANVHGKYKVNSILDVSDSVSLLLDVVSPGPFSITTQSVNGMVFSASGIFYNTGNYTVTLKGAGMPIAVGTTTVPLNILGVGCSFSIPVADTAITNSSMFWMYTVNGVPHNGYLDSAIRTTSVNVNYPSNTVYSIQAYGTPGGQPGSPITFQLNFARINHVLTVGMYNPGIVGSIDFIGYMSHADITGNLSASNNLPTFTMNLTSYDTVTRVMQGNFSGPVIDHLGQQQTIINGLFSTYFKK